MHKISSCLLFTLTPIFCFGAASTEQEKKLRIAHFYPRPGLDKSFHSDQFEVILVDQSSGEKKVTAIAAYYLMSSSKKIPGYRETCADIAGPRVSYHLKQALQSPKWSPQKTFDLVHNDLLSAFSSVSCTKAKLLSMKGVLRVQQPGDYWSLCFQTSDSKGMSVTSCCASHLLPLVTSQHSELVDFYCKQRMWDAAASTFYEKKARSPLCPGIMIVDQEKLSTMKLDDIRVK